MYQPARYHVPMRPIIIRTKDEARARRRRQKAEMRSAVAAGTLKVHRLTDMPPQQRAALERRLRIR